MKYSKTLRILGIAIILCLLIVALPTIPAQAQSVTTNPSSGPVGTFVTVTGTSFTAGDTYSVTFAYGTTFARLMATGTVTGTTFTATFGVPAVPRGSYTIQVVTTPGNFSSTFAVTPQITLSPSSGYVDDTVTVYGSGFTAGSVSIYFDTTSVATVTADASGSFTTATFTVPENERGSHTVKGRDTTGYSPDVSFTILSKITVTPASGAVGDQVTVSGNGFAANKNVTFFWDNTTLTAEADRTNSNGSFTNNTFTIPSTSRGSHTIKAQDASGNSATATFTVGQKIAITPTSGASGTTVTVTGTGFIGNRAITIEYNGVPVTTTPASVSTDANGAFTARFNVPAGLAGTYPVEATDGTYSYSTNFTATAAATISQTTSTASPGYVGMELTITGTGFRPNYDVTITYTTESVTLATVTTDDNGDFSVTVTIPPSAGGNHTITVTDNHSTKQFIFVMESQAPPIPAPLVPEEGKKAKAEAYFDWEDVTDDSLPVTYDLQIATDQEFTETSMVLEQEGLTDSEYTLTEEEKLESVSKEEPYYWRVRAIDAAFNASDWTTPGAFYVGFQWPELKGWFLYLVLGLSGLILLGIGFWLGRRTAYY